MLFEFRRVFTSWPRLLFFGHKHSSFHLIYKPEGFLIGATSVGSELAPTIAAKVKTGVAAHCVDVTINESGNLVCMVPAFGGKIVSEILVLNRRPQIASVRSGILSASKIPANADKIIQALLQKLA